MVKKLTRHGNTADTPLSVRTDGRALIVSPAGAPARRRRFAAALSRVNRRHGGALKRLAE